MGSGCSPGCPEQMSLKKFLELGRSKTWKNPKNLEKSCFASEANLAVQMSSPAATGTSPPLSHPPPCLQGKIGPEKRFLADLFGDFEGFFWEAGSKATPRGKLLPFLSENWGLIKYGTVPAARNAKISFLKDSPANFFAAFVSNIYWLACDT